MVLVKKKDGSWRFCVDYRKVNAITHKDVYPLSIIDDILTYLGEATFFTNLDLFSGYWQIPIREQDKEKTAFVTPDGHYEFNVLSFGLCSAPATFQQMADIVFKDLKWKEILIYLDDIIVFSKTFEEHLTRLRKVFDRLRRAKLTLKPSKCTYMYKKASVLGYEVSGDGIASDNSKLEAIQNFPSPKKVKDVKSFLGLCNYYRKFITKFSLVAKPLTNLTKIDIKFIWGTKQQNSFEDLKLKLTTAPVLAHFQPDAPTELRIDACAYGLGAVLLQEINGEWHAIS